jgi:hypothetical protein
MFDHLDVGKVPVDRQSRMVRAMSLKRLAVIIDTKDDVEARLGKPKTQPSSSTEQISCQRSPKGRRQCEQLVFGLAR